MTESDRAGSSEPPKAGAEEKDQLPTPSVPSTADPSMMENEETTTSTAKKAGAEGSGAASTSNGAARQLGYLVRRDFSAMTAASLTPDEDFDLESGDAVGRVRFNSLDNRAYEAATAPGAGSALPTTSAAAAATAAPATTVPMGVQVKNDLDKIMNKLSFYIVVGASFLLILSLASLMAADYGLFIGYLLLSGIVAGTGLYGFYHRDWRLTLSASFACVVCLLLAIVKLITVLVFLIATAGFSDKKLKDDYNIDSRGWMIFSGILEMLFLGIFATFWGFAINAARQATKALISDQMELDRNAGISWWP